MFHQHVFNSQRKSHLGVTYTWETRVFIWKFLNWVLLYLFSSFESRIWLSYWYLLLILSHLFFCFDCSLFYLSLAVFLQFRQGVIIDGKVVWMDWTPVWRGIAMCPWTDTTLPITESSTKLCSQASNTSLNRWAPKLLVRQWCWIIPFVFYFLVFFCSQDFSIYYFSVHYGSKLFHAYARFIKGWLKTVFFYHIVPKPLIMNYRNFSPF